MRICRESKSLQKPNVQGPFDSLRQVRRAYHPELGGDTSNLFESGSYLQ